MADTAQPPIVHFDFDGTLVHISEEKYSWQNFTKQDLPPVECAKEFLLGLISTRVDIGNIVSRRPNIWQRRSVTMRSIDQAGLSDFFDSKETVSLEGLVLPWWTSETRKAKRVVGDAEHRVTGMIEDKPHKLGLEMIRLMMKQGGVFEPIVLGAVDHPEAESRVSKLADYVLKEFGKSVDITEDDGAMQFVKHSRGSFALEVVVLKPFSFEEGQDFGNRLNDYDIPQPK